MQNRQGNMEAGRPTDFVETVDVTFHGVAYLLTVSTIEGETLCLEVEQKSDCSRWRGDFTSRCKFHTR